MVEAAVGDEPRIVAEPDNPLDSRALLVTDRGEVRLGYVPAPLLDVLHSAENWSVTVLQANGPEVGFHLRLLVRANMRVPPGYQPFSGAAWDTTR